MDGSEKIIEAQLFSRKAFFNNLTQEDISEEDYAHALNVWDKFYTKMLGDYHDLYLKTDVFLSTDVFE